ncbi:xanthine dehydrogenase family protein molybdopterin-binding subunit [Puniceibacterium confluentis]|uniref:xanthine dehydrogenase family protein molybdopterin-binding subunit n=1 Tax=Puniceibacterium confluentis TaxID=1958944 RepID=UPI0011B59966|nr:xanthine dehydrogenase family protein molybdopterin-binding subunit [Puniceibacterium confluentis]
MTKSDPGRIEDPRFLTGTGQFADDIRIDGALHAMFLRSDRAAGRLIAFDVTDARSVPGVIAVLTAADLAQDGITALLPDTDPPRHDGLAGVRSSRPFLCDDRIRMVGEALAMVVGDSLAACRAGLEALEPEIAEETAVVTTVQALAPQAPRIWPGAVENIAFLRRFGDRDAAARAIDAAAHVTRLEMNVSRVSAAPLEPRAALALPVGAGLELITGTQKPALVRARLAEALRLDPALVRVRVPDMGGSFGMKAGLLCEDLLVAWAALRLQRPVRWTADRAESFLSDEQARDVRITAELALDKDHRFAALRARLTVNIGAYFSGKSLGMIRNIGGIAGVYQTPAFDVEVAGMFSHTCPIAPYRGNGRPEATYAIERLVDTAARELGLDPVALRQKNLVRGDQMPWDTAFGGTYDCGDFAATLDRATVLADWPGFAARRRESEARGQLRGIGVAMPIETAGGPAKRPRPDRALVTLRIDGQVEIATGAVSSGQGYETAMPRMVAKVLGIPPEALGYSQGDTATVPDGRGTGGSGGAAVSVSAMFQAAGLARTRALELAARLLKAAPDEVALSDGLFRHAGSNRTVSLGDVAAAADPVRGLRIDHSFRPPGATYPNGCHIAEVEIDPETGTVTPVAYTSVEDVGTVLNQALVDGQLHGGIVQGMGQALVERLVHDETGQLLTASFMDYAMPRAADVPGLTLDSLPVPTALNPLGAKGVGEAGTVGALVAVMNAVNDALAGAGAGPLDTPATSHRVWAALDAAGRT